MDKILKHSLNLDRYEKPSPYEVEIEEEKVASNEEKESTSSDDKEDETRSEEDGEDNKENLNLDDAEVYLAGMKEGETKKFKDIKEEDLAGFKDIKQEDIDEAMKRARKDDL